MMNLEEAREQILDLLDLTVNKSLRETNGLHDLKEENGVLYVEVGLNKVGSEEETAFKKALTRLVKINLGYPGIKIKVYDINNILPTVNRHIITIGSGKGGVGKSTVTANIALALKRLGKKVGIIDADIYGPSIPSVMELEMKDVLGDDNGKMLPFVENGIEVISTEYFTDHEQPIMWRGGMLGKMLGHFFNDVLWSEDIEYLLVDMPPGTGDVAIDMKEYCPDAKMIIVTTPHLGSAQIAVKAGYGAMQLGQSILGVVENMAYFTNPVNGEKEYIFGKGGGPLVSIKLNTNLLGQIEIGQPSGNMHSLFEETDSNGIKYKEIARKIIDSYEVK